MNHADIPAPAHLNGVQKRRWDRLMEALDSRQAWNGHPFVTPSEAWLLKSWGLKQPGHTRYPYSVPNENLSDAAQGV